MTLLMVTTLDRRETISAPTEEALMVRKAQVLVEYAIDRWIGVLAREQRAETTRRKYREYLDPFGQSVRHKATDELVRDDFDAFVDRYANHSASTLALVVTVMRGFGQYLEDTHLVKRNPADHLRRPRRKRPEDLDVVTLSPDDARTLIQACHDDQERICLGVLLYMGVRRTAAANIRRRDVNLKTGAMKFLEKGGKPIVKVMPDELLAYLRERDDDGQWVNGDAWLIPNRKPWLVKTTKQRGHKIVYETVKRVAARTGIQAHPHAFRGAYAVAFDEAHPDLSLVLKDLLGHARMDTTMVYLRRRNKIAGMEAVRDLSFGLRAHKAIPPAGFEPAFEAHEQLAQDAPETSGLTIAETLLEEASNKAQTEKPTGRVTG